MFKNRPAAVYKCIIPVETSLTSAGQSEETAKTLNFPAWPAIDAPNRPCCLPTLMRAVYFVHRSRDARSKEIVTRAEKYLRRQDGIKHEIKEEALAIIKSEQAFWHDLPKMTAIPRILFGPIDTTNFVERFGHSMEISEVLMQASIYANLSNFYEDGEAFAFGHEYAHVLGSRLYSGVVLDYLSAETHRMLFTLARAEVVSREQIAQLWVNFEEINWHIQRLTQKFEPLEEIFATYAGLRFSPPEVRNKIEGRVEEELRKRKWDKAYEAFVEACEEDDEPLGTSLFITDVVCRMVQKCDKDGADISTTELLCAFLEVLKIIKRYMDIVEQRIGSNLDEWELLKVTVKVAREDGLAEGVNSILEKARIPSEIFWSVMATIRDVVFPELARLFNTIKNNGLSALDEYLSFARITLIGRPSEKAVGVNVFFDEEEDKAYALYRTFFESLRQQLCQNCGEEVVEIVCPFDLPYRGHDVKSCGCVEIRRLLYERLPKTYKSRFKLPNYGAVTQ